MGLRLATLVHNDKLRISLEVGETVGAQQYDLASVEEARRGSSVAWL